MRNFTKGLLLVVFVVGALAVNTTSARGALVLSIVVDGQTLNTFDSAITAGLAAGHYNNSFGDNLYFSNNGTYLGSSAGGYTPTGSEVFQVTIKTLDLVSGSTPYDSRLTLSAGAAIAGLASGTPSVSMTLSAAGQQVVPGYLNTATYSLSAGGSGTSSAPPPTVTSTYQDANNTVGPISAAFSGPGTGIYTVTEPAPVLLPGTMVPSNFSTSITAAETFVNNTSQSVTFTAQADVTTPEPGTMTLWGLALFGVAGTGMRRRLASIGASVSRLVRFG